MQIVSDIEVNSINLFPQLTAYYRTNSQVADLFQRHQNSTLVQSR